MTADASHAQRATGSVPRRTRALVVAGEVALAAAVGGVVVGGALGWTIAALAVVPVALGVAMLRGSWLPTERRWRPTGADSTGMRVQGVLSRSSGEVAVIGDAQGYAAGVELDTTKGALVDLASLCASAADDPSRPSAVQVRVTTYAPSAPGSGTVRGRAATSALHRRVHIVLRLEPSWAGDVVASHGGGAAGGRAALVAAVDRLSARLRRAGTSNRILDPAALNALLAEDTAPELRSRVFAADASSQADVDRLVGLLQQAAPERSVLSVCVDLASSEHWQSFVAVLVGGRDPGRTDAASAAVLNDPAVAGVAPSAAITAVLPLGGGPGDLAAVLTLARA